MGSLASGAAPTAIDATYTGEGDHPTFDDHDDNSGGVDTTPNDGVDDNTTDPTAGPREEQGFTFNLVAEDGENDALTFSILEAPSNGTLDKTGGAGTNCAATYPALDNAKCLEVTYTGDTDFAGTDTFTFRVNDGLNNSGAATITLEVGDDQDDATANWQVVDVPEDDAGFVITLSGSDPDGAAQTTDPTDEETLIFSTASNAGLGLPRHGTLVADGDATDDSVTYKPDPGYYGQDTFVFSVTDGVGAVSLNVPVSINVTSVNDVPTADDVTVDVSLDEVSTYFDIDGSASDPDGDPLSWRFVNSPEKGTLGGGLPSAGRYTPRATTTAGTDVVTYEVSDGNGGKATGVITFNLYENSPPAAADIEEDTFGQTPAAITLAGTDADNDPLTYQVHDLPTNGYLVGTPPTFSYIADEDFIGTDTFTYTVTDGLFTSDEATVTINVGAEPADACDEFGFFYGDHNSLASDADVTGGGPVKSRFLGKAVANIGDINNDGFDNVAVGVPGDGDGGFRAGAVYVFETGPGTAWGGATTSVPETLDLDADAMFKITGPNVGDLTGWAITGGADLTGGDSIDDIVISAPGTGRNRNNRAGTVWIVAGNDDPTSSTYWNQFNTTDKTLVLGTHHAAKFVGDRRRDSYGGVISVIGDVNGDGLADLGVGATGADVLDNGGVVLVQNAGAAYVHLQPAGGFTGASDYTADDAEFAVFGETKNDQVGSSFSGAGNFDGDVDGIGDFVFGAQQFDALEPGEPEANKNSGAAFVFAGSNSWTPGQAQAVMTVDQAELQIMGDPYARMGSAAGWQGADGIWVGAKFDRAFIRSAGAAYFIPAGTTGGADNVILSSELREAAESDTWADGEPQVILGEDIYDAAGVAVTTADMNGDGEADIIVGADRADSELGDERFVGAVYVLYGPLGKGVTNLSEADGRMEGFDRVELAGSAIATFGNGGENCAGNASTHTSLNGDCYADLVVGSWRGGPNGRYSGRVSGFYGGADLGDPVTVYADLDQDGFGAGVGTETCVVSESAPGLTVTQSLLAGDCDDDASDDPGDPATGPLAAERHPGATIPTRFLSTCVDGSNTVDYNCDGDPEVLVNSTATDDADGDGTNLCLDCNDADATVEPGAAEQCDAVDNDCDGDIDDADSVPPANAKTWYNDADEDGYGHETLVPLVEGVTSCRNPFVGVPFATVGGDCNDTDGAGENINPGAAEYCDTIDNDCDGITDESDAVDAHTYYRDADSDGDGEFTYELRTCEDDVLNLPGYSTNSLDCDDNDETVETSDAVDADEVCDFKDNDCDGLFYRGGQTDVSDARMRLYGSHELSEFGVSVEFIIDGTDPVNGNNGFAVGAQADSADRSGGGAVYMMYGFEGAVDFSTPDAAGMPYYDARIAGQRQRAQVGSDLATADFNGDNCPDLAVGAANDPRPGGGQGSFGIFFGAAPSGGVCPPFAGNISYEEADVIITGMAAGDALGSELQVGDVNGDGRADLMVGAPEAQDSSQSTVANNQGYAAIISGQTLTALSGGETKRLDQVPHVYFWGLAAGEQAGSVVAILGDVSGDSNADVAVGAQLADTATNEDDNGAAYVFNGPITLPTGATGAATDLGAPDVTITGTNGQRIGRAIAAVNIDDDADMELAVGSIRGMFIYDNGNVTGGIPYYTQVDDQGTPSTADDVITHHANADYEITTSGHRFSFATDIEDAGDFNGDGIGDIAVANPSDRSRGGASGAVFVIYGGQDWASLDTRPSDVTGFVTVDVAGIESYGRLNGDDQVNTINIAGAANDEDYTVTIEGWDYTFTTDASATLAELTNGLASVIEGGANNPEETCVGGSIEADDTEGVITITCPWPGVSMSENHAALSIDQPELPMISARGTFAPEGAKIVPDQESARLGIGMAAGADINGDGLTDLGAGAPLGEDPVDRRPLDSGSAYLVYGGRYGLDTTGDLANTAPTDPLSGAAGAATYYFDNDGDGFSVSGSTDTFTACDSHVGYNEDNGNAMGITDSSLNTDCDDTEDSTYPGAPDVNGDNVDSDCDGKDTAKPPVRMITGFSSGGGALTTTVTAAVCEDATATRVEVCNDAQNLDEVTAATDPFGGCDEEVIAGETYFIYANGENCTTSFDGDFGDGNWETSCETTTDVGSPFQAAAICDSATNGWVSENDSVCTDGECRINEAVGTEHKFLISIGDPITTNFLNTYVDTNDNDVRDTGEDTVSHIWHLGIGTTQQTSLTSPTP